MKILLTGASGFLGGHLLAALRAAGHAVVCAGRSPIPGCVHVEADFASATPPDWAAALAGVDAVINTVGIFRGHGRASFEALHVRAPAALFDACVAAGVRHVIQVSALGADAGAVSDYQRSKHAADTHLLALPLAATVLQPSLVFGADGASTRRFLVLASAPLLVLPGGGRPVVQPVHVDDVVAAVLALLEGHEPPRRVALVGPRALSFADYLLALRARLGLPRCAVLALPRPIVRMAAWFGDRRRDALFDSAAWRMLERGSTADAAGIAALLGRAPRDPGTFVEPREAAALRAQAQDGWLLPLLRGSLAAVWLWTAVVSAGLYPVEDSLDLLARTGAPEALRPLLLYGAAAVDALLGMLTLAPLRPARRRALWLVQIGLIVFYTAVITLKLPGFWLHPYGPLSKNLPMLALLVLLWAKER